MILADPTTPYIKHVPSLSSGTDIKPALLRHNSYPIMNIIKILRLVAMDGFITCHTSQKTSGSLHDCPVLELVLEAAPEGNPELVKTYQSTVLVAIMRQLEAGNEDITVTLRDIGSFGRAVVGLSVFCTRLIDKLWQGLYAKPSEHLYKFLKKLVEQAITKPKILPLVELQRALNRIILYQLSTVPKSEPEQKELVDTLCMLSSHAHVIFDETNTDHQFFQCLVYRLLALVFGGELQRNGEESPLHGPADDHEAPAESGETAARMKPPSHGYKGYVPIMTSSLLKSGANRLWSKLLEHKREILELILAVPLPIPPPTSTLQQQPNIAMMASISDVSNALQV